MIVKPETLIGWHRTGFRLWWRWKSRLGRPRIQADLRQLIVRMVRENPAWGEERVAAELSVNLGILVSPRTVRAYWPQDTTPKGGRRSSSQHWLLRSKGIQVGANKDEFQANLTAAIESGELTLEDVRAWLASVEGWGDQHVYLYNISSTLRKELTEPKIRKRVSSARLDGVWNGETALAFPDEPQLTSISFNDSVLRLVWQETSPDWAPAPEKDYQKEEGLDLYEYRAFRKVEWRAITRFEARVKEGIAGLFIPDPIQGPEHKAAIEEAKRVLRLLMDVDALERQQMDIAVISRNLDQQNVPTNKTPSPQVKAQRSRLTSGGASVEFAANSTDKAYWEEPAIQDVRNSVRPQQLRSFQGADGVFIFQKNSLGLTRPLRVQLYGKERRVRLRAQMEVSEVWTILAKLGTQQ